MTSLPLRCFRRWLFAAILVLCPISAVAQQQEEGPQLKQAAALFQTWEQQAAASEKALTDGWRGNGADERRRAQLEEHRDQSRILSDKAKEAAAPLQAQITALGPPPAEGETEDESVTKERAELQKRIDELKAVTSKGELAFTRADRLLSLMAEARRQKFTDQLLTRGPSPLDPGNWALAGQSFIQTSANVASETATAAIRTTRKEFLQESGPIALLALLLALILMVVARKQVLRWLYSVLGAADDKADATHHTNGDGIDLSTDTDAPNNVAGSRAKRLFVGVGVTLTRLAMPLAALFAARFALIKLQVFGDTGEVVLDGIAWGAAIIATSYAISYAFFAPQEPRLRLSLLEDSKASTAARHSMLIAVTMALNYALVVVGETLRWPVGALAVLNAILICAGSLALWQFARATEYDEKAVQPTASPEENSGDDPELWLSHGAGRLIRRIAYAVALASPLLALAGYFALSRFVFYNTVFSAAVVAAGILLFSVAKEGTSALSEATRDRRGRDAASEQDEPGLLPVFVGFFLILIALPILSLIWGATLDDLGEVYYGISNGFKIGDTVFRPGDLLIAAVIFGLGLFVTRVIQAVMRRTVMPRTKLDTGARSSIVSGLGYVGFFVSALVAIGAGGLDLTNLAFLGAALGVGIGFGLQNIVNNFVSGIILLIERPIKVGDWIEVAGTHGTVEKVNVRSTEIKTFDKASYIVPNSELISGAVMNMTHGDLMGRVIAPIGVAYGTDVRQVEKILMEIANAHPMILRRPGPSVVFKAFGADSLDFELRGFLRDVNWILSTTSDINFEIERRFREEGIEIPFAQRDVTIKNAEAIMQTLKDSVERPPIG